MVMFDYTWPVNGRNRGANTIKKRCSIFFLQRDLDATVADNGFVADIPALDENEPPAEIRDLSTIDTDTLDRLCEEVQPAQTSQLV